MAYISNQAILEDAVRRRQILANSAARGSTARALADLYRDQLARAAEVAGNQADVDRMTADILAQKQAAGTIGTALGDVGGSIMAGTRTLAAGPDAPEPMGGLTQAPLKDLKFLNQWIGRA